MRQVYIQVILDKAVIIIVCFLVSIIIIFTFLARYSFIIL